MSDSDNSDSISIPEVVTRVKRLTIKNLSKQVKVSATGTKTIIEEPVEKRKPGRPPKNDKYRPPELNGISDTPMFGNTVVEFTYSETLIAKGIFQMLKAFNGLSGSIQLIFKQEELLIYSHTRDGKSNILIRFDCNKVQHYHVAQEIEFGLTFSEIEKYFSQIDGTYQLFSLCVEKRHINKWLTIKFQTKFEVDEDHCVQIISDVNRLEDRNIFSDDAYEIDIISPTSFIDKIASDLNKFKINEFSFTQEDYLSPIIITGDTETKKSKSKYQFAKPTGKIIFTTSRDAESNSFEKSQIKTASFTPLAKLFTENMHLYLSETEPLLIRASDLDEAIEVRITID